MTTLLNIAPAIIFICTKNDYKMLGGYSLLSEDNNGILNSGFVHLRHNFKLAERIKTFGFQERKADFFEPNASTFMTKRRALEVQESTTSHLHYSTSLLIITFI